MAGRPAAYADRLVATPWIALLGFLALSQAAHLLEHVAQMVQIHMLHLSGANAQGIVGQLNIEWVHFTWNALVLVTLLVLLPRFPTNPWLIAVTPLAAWHFVDHSVMIATYVQTGVSEPLACYRQVACSSAVFRSRGRTCISSTTSSRLFPC